MSDLLVHFLERVLGERELSLMNNAPDAVKKIALAITLTVTVVEIVVFWIIFSLIFGKHIDTLQATISFKDEQITGLQNSLNSLKEQEKNSTTKGTDSPQSLGKYVCTTTLPSESGKHALLVEFGVRQGQTNGFVGEVHFATLYAKVETWIGTPLRTERQRVVAMKLDHNIWETPDHLSYAERFMSPFITPRLSYYLYFEAVQPLQVKSLFFIEDPLALSDQLRTNTLAKDVTACPR